MTENFFGKTLAARPVECIPGMLDFDIPVHGDNPGWFKENFQPDKMLPLAFPESFLQKENYKITLPAPAKTFFGVFTQGLGMNTSLWRTVVRSWELGSIVERVRLLGMPMKLW